jgi:DNA-directed RNA polymerase specialized sigma24 family protein
MSSVTYLIGQFKQGQSSAFGVLFGRFFAYPVDLARRRLRGESTLPLDGEDIAQMVFWELHRAVRQHRPMGERLSDTASLLTTLASLTRQQVRRQRRDHTRQCRDCRKSRLAADLPVRGDTDPFAAILDPGASHRHGEIECRETIEQLLVLLPSAKHRTLVRLLSGGHSIPEIARELHRSVRTVERYVIEIRTLCQSHAAGQAFLRQCPILPSIGKSTTADR